MEFSEILRPEKHLIDSSPFVIWAPQYLGLLMDQSHANLPTLNVDPYLTFTM